MSRIEELISSDKLDGFETLTRADLNTPNTDNDDKLTPLEYAIINDKYDAIGALIKAGANPDMINNGRTPLWYAFDNNKYNAIEALTNAGANLSVTIPKYSDRTIIYSAILFSKVDVIEALGRAVFDINAPDHDGITPLKFAINDSNEKSIIALLKAGADVRTDLLQWVIMEEGRDFFMHHLEAGDKDFNKDLHENISIVIEAFKKFDKESKASEGREKKYILNKKLLFKAVSYPGEAEVDDIEGFVDNINGLAKKGKISTEIGETLEDLGRRNQDFERRVDFIRIGLEATDERKSKESAEKPSNLLKNPKVADAGAGAGAGGGLS